MNPGVLTVLRDFVPIRPLTRTEAYRIAELQVARFLKIMQVNEAPINERIIAELPRLQVQRFSPLPVSGATQWSNGRWMIILNANESTARQRFSLAHEFKHIIDHRFIDILYARVAEDDREDFIESICDYFAGCLLVPRPWLKKAWGEGLQRPADLATHFGVSQQAIQVRLSQTGLTGRQRRCGQTASDWRLPRFPRTGTTEGYHRRALAGTGSSEKGLA